MVMYANEFKTKENQKLAEIQKLTATHTTLLHNGKEKKGINFWFLLFNADLGLKKLVDFYGYNSPFPSTLFVATGHCKYLDSIQEHYS